MHQPRHDLEMLRRRLSRRDDVLNWRVCIAEFFVFGDVEDATVNGCREVRFPWAVVNQEARMICALAGGRK